MKSKYLKSELWPEQAEAVPILTKNDRMILADSTGLGKTLSLLATFISLYEQNPDYRMLVFSNKSSLATWKKDIPKHTQGIDYLILDTPDMNNPNIIRIVNEPHPPITILSYNVVIRNLKHFVRKLYQSGKPIMLVLEEAHYCKNPKAKRTQAIKPYVEYATRCYMCTATPINNHYADMFGLFDLLVPGLLGTKAYFDKYYCNYEWIKHSWVNGKKVLRKNPYPKFKAYKHVEELKEKVSPYILKRVKRYNVKFHTIPVDFTKQEENMYVKSARGILTAEYKEFVSRLPELQLATDNTIREDGFNTEKKPSSKELVLFKGLISQVQQDGEAVIIFSAFKKVLDRLQFLIKSSKLEYNNLYRLDGNTSSDERYRITQEFGPKDILLVSPAGKESLNLQQSHIIWVYNLPFSLGDFVQLIGRIARNDSQFDQFDVYLPIVRNTIDEYKARMLLYKSREFQKILTGEAAMPKTWKRITRSKLETIRRKLLWRQDECKRKTK